ncbi:hypothetical protein PP707_05465 [Acetobacter pasteurianus]|nr:hypothetical protein [Acetobacter pasteurianus]
MDINSSSSTTSSSTTTITITSSTSSSSHSPHADTNVIQREFAAVEPCLQIFKKLPSLLWLCLWFVFCSTVGQSVIKLLFVVRIQTDVQSKD